MLRQYTTGTRCNARSGKLGERRRLAPDFIREDVDMLKRRVFRLGEEWEEALRGVFREITVDRAFLESVRTTRVLMTMLKK